jgi:hypothetical protein
MSYFCVIGTNGQIASGHAPRLTKMADEQDEQRAVIKAIAAELGKPMPENRSSSEANALLEEYVKGGAKNATRNRGWREIRSCFFPVSEFLGSSQKIMEFGSIDFGCRYIGSAETAGDANKKRRYHYLQAWG